MTKIYLLRRKDSRYAMPYFSSNFLMKISFSFCPSIVLKKRSLYGIGISDLKENNSLS